jgi:hypothetical protein
MISVSSDHVHPVLIVVLVALALLLAMVESAGREPVRLPDPTPVLVPVVWMSDPGETRAWDGLEQWAVARKLYRSGEVEAAREQFESVLAAFPHDPAVRMWAGMTAYHLGDREMALRHWETAWGEEARTSVLGVWPAIALAATHLELGQVDEAARRIVPLERGDVAIEPSPTDHPVVGFYAALVYEQLAHVSRDFRDAVEESLGERFSPCLAANDGSGVVPNSRSWLVFLARWALTRTIREAQRLDWSAPVIPAAATAGPALAPTVEDLLACLGSADFAVQARGKLRALQHHELRPSPEGEIYDAPMFERGHLIAEVTPRPD